MQSLDIIQSPPLQPIFDTQRLIMALNQNTHALRSLEDGVRILDINVQPDIPWHNAGVDAYVSIFSKFKSMLQVLLSLILESIFQYDDDL